MAVSKLNDNGKGLSRLYSANLTSLASANYSISSSLWLGGGPQAMDFSQAGGKSIGHWGEIMCIVSCQRRLCCFFHLWGQSVGAEWVCVRIYTTTSVTLVVRN